MSVRKEWDDYFQNLVEPSQLLEYCSRVKEFIDLHTSQERPIVLITSGGTAVPLETNTVRFVDNFSSGMRGASSAEYFLQAGYAVIFLHRSKSLEPFNRHWSQRSLLSLLETRTNPEGCVGAGKTTICVKPALEEKVARELAKYQRSMESNSLLLVPFTTLSDYLFYLREFAKLLSKVSAKVMFYLAAAVSDFYVPEERMPEHKIQSSSGPLQLSLVQVPKMLSPLIKDWSPGAFVVSFKLETDEAIIAMKARQALQKYNHQVVISNLLATRRHKVVLVTQTSELTIEIKKESDQEVEELIIAELAVRHREFLTERP